MAAVKRAKVSSDYSRSKFKIYFNRGNRMTGKTALQVCTLTFEDDGLNMSGDEALRIQFADILSLRLEYPHSSAVRAHLIEVKYLPSEVLYFGVLRGTLFKAFVLNNLFETVRLFEKIRKHVPRGISYSILD